MQEEDIKPRFETRKKRAITGPEKMWKDQGALGILRQETGLKKELRIAIT